MKAIIGTALCLLAWSVADSPTPMPEYVFENWVKLSFCESIKKQAVYKREDLEINCAAKVQFFENQVRKLVSFAGEVCDRLLIQSSVFENTETFSSFLYFLRLDFCICKISLSSFFPKDPIPSTFPSLASLAFSSTSKASTWPSPNKNKLVCFGIVRWKTQNRNSWPEKRATMAFSWTLAVTNSSGQRLGGSGGLAPQLGHREHSSRCTG